MRNKKMQKMPGSGRKIKKQIEEVTEQAKRAAADLVNYKQPPKKIRKFH